MGPWRWPLLCCLHAALLRGTVLAGGQRPQEGPPQPAGWSPAPSSSWAPTAEPGAPGDPEGSAAALVFLQTGDAQRLAQANCSRGVTAGPPGPGPPPALRATLRAAPEALAHAANFLNMLFQSNDIREASVAEDVEWYQALVRSLAEGHPWVRRAVLALDAHPLAAKPRLMLQATKRDGDILLQDISGAASKLGNLSWDNEWFNALKSQRRPPLRKRVLSNDLRSMDTPKWQRGDSYVGEPGHVRWSPPFLECRDGRFLPAWAVTLSAAFYGLKPDLSPEFKGVVRVDIELRDVAVDQCASGPGWFADTHRCDLNSTQCVPQESRGFVLGRYLCRCKPGFYGAGGVASGNQAGAAGSTAGTSGGSRLGCRRCRQGCATCEDDSPCLVQEDGALRAAVLSCQACCMLAVFLSMLVSYHFRRSKRIRASGVVLLEMILFGSLLLYFPVFILYFKPSIFRCIVLRWVRMLGFAIVYGTITLKLYRVLKLFLSRTAQRAPYVSSGWVLKMLGLILLLVLWFLAAWTVGMLENVDKNIPLVIRTQTARGLRFYICGHDRWDYMMVIAELLFLLWGSSLCFATRAVPSAFHEPRYLGIALHNELLVSAAFHLLRFIVVPSLHPDWTLLLFFAHTHGTITMTLALLFIPKFLHAGSPLREEIAAEVYEDELDMRRSGSCLNSSITSAWSEHSLDPDDIREELKKLYTQLELHKTRRMAASNPHLPKKRASRRSLGRSIARRLAELPNTAARRTSAGDRVGTPTHRTSPGDRVGTPTHRTSAGDHVGTPTHRTSAGDRVGTPTHRTSAGDRVGTPTHRTSPGDRVGTPTHWTSAGDRVGTPTHRTSVGDRVGTPTHRTSPGDRDRVGTPTHRTSVGDRVGTPAHRSPLAKQSPNASGASLRMWDDSSRCHAASLRKSRSTEGPAQEPPGGSPTPGSTAVGRKMMVVTGSEQSDSDSLDAAPLVCKSASAHNLGGPGQPPPPRAPPLQKSLSAVTGAREEALLAASRAARDDWHPNQHPSSPASGHPNSQGPPREARKPTQSPPPAEGCSQDTSPPGDGRAQKHVTYAPTKSISVDSSQRPGRVRVAVRRTPPPPPIRYQSLGRHTTAGDSPEPPAQAGMPEGTAVGTAGDDPGCVCVPAGKGRLPPAAPIPAQVCPWELVQEEILSRRQKATEAAELGTPGDAAATPSTEPPSHRISLWGLGLAIKAFTRSRGKSIRRGRRESEGTPGKRGRSRRQRPPLAETATVSLGGTGRAPASKSPAWSRQRPGSEPPARPWQGDADPCQRNNNAVTAGDTAGWGDSGAGGQRDSLALDSGDSGAGGQRDSLALGWGDSGAGGQRDSLALGSGDSGAGGQRDSLALGSGDSGAGGQRDSLALDSGDSGAGGQRDSLALGSGDSGAGGQRDSLALGSGDSGAGGQRDSLALGSGDSGAGGQRDSLALGSGDSGAGGQRDSLALGSGDSGAGRQRDSLALDSGDSGAGGQRDSLALGTGDEEKGAEEPSAPQGDRDAGGGSETPSGVREVPPSAGHQEGAECPHGTPAVAGSGRAGTRPWEGDKGPAEDPGKDAPAATMGLVTPQEGVGEGLEGVRGSIGPWNHPEGEQPPAGSPPPGAEVCPRGVGGVPGFRGALLRQEAIAPREDGGVPRGWETPAEAQGKGGGQPEPPGPGGPARSRGGEGSPAAAGKAGGRQGGVCAGQSRGDSSVKIQICPREESGGSGGAPGNGSRGGGPGKAPGKTLERGDTVSETGGGGRRAEVCPWESEEGARSIPAEICPWDAGGAQEGDGRRGGKGGKSLRAPALGLLRAGGSGSSLRAPGRPRGSIGSEGPPPQPAPQSSELPGGTPRSPVSGRAAVCPWEVAGGDGDGEVCPGERGTALPDAGKTDDGEISEGNKGISPQRASPGGTGETPPAGDMGSGWRGPPSPREGAGEPGVGLAVKPPALPKTSSEAAGTIESKKATICPWEEEGEPAAKTEICPWEEAAAPLGKERAAQDMCGTSKGENKPGAGGREDVKAKLAERGGRRPECRDSGIFAKLVRKSLEGSRAETKKSPSVESIREEKLESVGGVKAEICPWESLGTEQNLEKSHTRSSVLPKSSSKKSQSAESLKAEVCPWDAPEVGATDKAEICPWEAAVPAQPKAQQGPGGGSKGDRHITRQAALARPGRSLEKGSSERQAVCPWESMDTELPPEQPRASSPALPKSSSKKSQSAESLKAEVCPWDAPELGATDKAEICPWEAAAPPSDKEKLNQDKAGLAMGSRRPSADQGLGKEVGAGTSAKEKGSQDRASVCPWESLSTDQPLEKPRTGSSVLPKSSSKKSQSAESLKAEVCPWDAPEAEAGRAEICPWESTDTGGSSAGHSTRSTELLKPTPKELESTGGVKAEICPWESLGTEQNLEKPRAGSPVLPKSSSKKSQSTESLKAEVCPWDAPEVGATDKAEICPWEAAAPPSDKEKLNQDKAGLAMGSRSASADQGLGKQVGAGTSAKEKGSHDRASVCPWESLDMEQPLEKPRVGSPVLPKSSSKKSKSAESLKAEICPWDAPEVGATDKAEICPWEAAAPPSDKEKLNQDKAGLAMGSRRPSADQGLGKEVGAGTSAKEKGSQDRASVCPWESLSTDQPLEKPRTGSSVLPKSSSKKSQSAESLKAEVCPWDAPEAEAGRAEICPWESTDTGGSSAGHSTRSTELLKPTPKELESTGGVKAEICPWESLGTEQNLEKPRAGSPVLPKSSSKKSQSAESLKAEVCPWDAPEAEAGRAEICPWEAAASLPEKGAALGKASLAPRKAGASEAPGKGSSEREAICPWESPATEESSPKTAVEKETSKKSDSLESRRSDLCPWEAAEPSGVEKESSKPSVHPPGAGRASSMGTGKSGASTMPPTALPKKGRSSSEAEHKPLCRILPSAQPRRDPSTEPLSRGVSMAPRAGSTPSPGTGITEVCPWEAEEAPPAPSETSPDPRKTSEVCPWEVESGDPTPTLHGQGRAQGTPGDGDGGVSDPNICPWDHE